MNSFIKRNFGINYKACRQVLKKNALTTYAFRAKKCLTSFINRNYRRYNIMLRTRLIKIQYKNRKQSSWKGLMMKNRLPLYGQRTHTNAQTAKRKK